MDQSLPGFIEKGRQAAADSACSRSFFLRFVAWCMTAVWRTCVDWRAKRPLLIRATAHLSIIALAFTAIALSGIGLPAPQVAVGGSPGDNTTFSAAMNASAQVEATPSPTPIPPTSESHTTATDTITRLPVPHTTFPERPRAEVITYTVRQDDNIFTIASQFDLAPETIVWSNREAIQDAPWLIQPGLQLFILPVDGVYHTVRAGETVKGIADEYGVASSALYNEWNDLEEEDPLREGQLLVIPGGESGEVAWSPPEPEPTQPQYSYRTYSGGSAAAPSANNWFILPTGSTRVSGWYFHDPRNPMHIGLDYQCSQGDPLYAADNGTVTIAGWNGGYGILVEISHGNGFTTRYGHLSQLLVGGGQPVHQGDIIGYCGTTGWSTGPHLHFEIRKNGVPQDPMAYQ